MKILLTDGSGLTSRQVATQAAAAGHAVEALSASRFGLASFTRHVQRVHTVPAFGRDPDGWLEAAIDVLRKGGHNILLPTQEQVAVLSRDADRITQRGVGLAVPPFESLRRVQDKIAQRTTLRELGLPHPPSRIVRSRADLAELQPPVYLKAPIGTASNAVHLASNHDEVELAASQLDLAEGIIAQAPLPGPLIMIQSVFSRGRLVAWHANLRERQGSSGGASVKRSITPPDVREHLEILGRALAWHGALSLDAILTTAGPSYIDLNPRLVEPGNAWRAGTDLVEAMLAISRGLEPELAPSRPGIRTHQLLLGLLGTAQQGKGRRGIGEELARALIHHEPYANSVEELTPLTDDPVAAVPVAAAALATLIDPHTWRLFANSAVSAYALTPAAWKQITSTTLQHSPQNTRLDPRQ